ncbi:MAG: class I tRNA ligase family protein, partial [Desulfurococcaceae archaeon]|nr:class I tRNA ligase family protein [Desulfurococcaceae archaeon]
VLYELNNMLKSVSSKIWSGDLHLAAREILNFIVEILSHRYITIIRPRVWLEEDAPEKRAAYATLYITISSLLKTLAPFAPYISEYLYQAFVKRYSAGTLVKESVHQELWPKLPEEILREDMWKAAMLMFKVADEVLAIRNSYGVKRRWPLKQAVVVVPPEQLELFKKSADILRIYANIKNVEVVDKILELRLAKPVEVDLKDVKAYIDIAVDEEILMEGLVRDIVRRVQMLRKEKNLPVNYVAKKLAIYSDAEIIRKAVEKYRDYIGRETRVEVVEISLEKHENAIEYNLEEYKVYIALEL